MTLINYDKFRAAQALLIKLNMSDDYHQITMRDMMLECNQE